MLSNVDPIALAALRAVLDTGSFEKAGTALGVTPSAITQRIQRLEDRIGIPLVLRSRPCMATAAGARLRRRADDVALLEKELLADLDLVADTPWPRLRIALNADSLATWFVDAMARLGDYRFDLVIDDQDHSLDLLRRGEVMAAVAAESEPVRGCAARPLGALAYVATASPEFYARWFPDGITASALASAPMMVFDSKDRLQARWAERAVAGPVAGMPEHRIPSTTAFVEVAKRGLGWGINPEALVADAIEEGHLVSLGERLETPLYWHWNARLGDQFSQITRRVRAVAQEHLRPF